MLPEDVFMRKEGASELAFFLCSGVDVAAGLSSGTVAALASLLRVRPLLSAHDAAGLERLENREERLRPLLAPLEDRLGPALCRARHAASQVAGA